MTRCRIVSFILTFCGMLSIAGCATPAPTPEPIVRTIEVPVPVPVKCTPMLDPEPDYPDTDAAFAETTLFRGVAILKAGRLMRMAREAELKAALAGCAGG